MNCGKKGTPRGSQKSSRVWIGEAPQIHNKNHRSAKTYNIRDSPVVTHPSTSLTITSLSMGERTGSRVFWYLWSYVTDEARMLLICLGIWRFAN
ncbi:hypothetical protein NKR19_g9955 [Coniochaeta hoffmannii]|uniref:Uncharacterized protein n=1 Tax=Coniochaeta hoffmannii TaxID=91930 RepID=A0AA38VG84_9PEZI|nr:hypothetical protein NKR19_g9955 [Coniochaeta hoffmannii]